MIWLTKSEIDTNIGRINFTIRIDAKAARISESKKMGKIQSALNSKIDAFSNDLRRGRDFSEYEQALKEYLCNEVFKYGINIVAVNDFIYDIRLSILKFSKNIAIAGLIISYEYKNYEGEIIWLTSVTVGDSGQVYFTVRIDADAAKIRDKDEKQYVESTLGLKMVELANAIKEDDDYREREKEEDLSFYLRKDLFHHLVDLKVIETFIDNFEDKVVEFMKDIKKIGFEILFEYRNHPWQEED